MISEVTELDMPDLRGEDGSSSAAACLLAVCHYFGCQPHGGGDFERLLERADQGGATPDDIVRAAQDVGLEAGVNPMSVDALVTAIEDGHPVIADLGGRYAVVFGVTTAGLLVMDPTRGHDVLPMEQWPGQGIVLDMPGAERQTENIERQLHPHEALAHHYSNVWNVLHEQGQQVPHWELAGAHENLSGTDWHVDLGHDGVWRPLHVEDMQRVYLWPKVEKRQGFGVRKSWDENKHPRAPKGSGHGGEFASSQEGGNAIPPDDSQYERRRGPELQDPDDYIARVEAAHEQLVARGKLKTYERTYLPLDWWKEEMIERTGFSPEEVETAVQLAFSLGIDPTKSDDLYSLEEYMSAVLEDIEEGGEGLGTRPPEKGHGAAVEKAGRRRKVDPQQGLFGQWTEGDKPTPRKTPQSSEAFEGMHPRRGQGSGGGRFAKINTGNAPGQQSLFGAGGYEERAPQESASAAIPETAEQREMAHFSIMQNLSTGRLDSETERKVMDHLGADSLGDAYAKLRNADGKTLAEVQEIIGPRRGNGAHVENPEAWQLIGGDWRENKTEGQAAPPVEHKPQQGGLFGQGGYAERAGQELTPAAEAAVEGTHHAPKGGVTLAGTFFAGGRFIPNEAKEEATPEEKQDLLNKEHEQLQQADQQLGEPEYPKAAAQVQETRQQKVEEARKEAAAEPAVMPMTQPPLQPHGVLLSFHADDKRPSRSQREETAQQLIAMGNQAQDRLKELHYYRAAQAADDAVRLASQAGRVQDTPTRQHLHDLVADLQKDLAGRVAKAEAERATTTEAKQTVGTQESLPEVGFTGIDANGHEWVNGEQVARGGEEPQPEPPAEQPPVPEPAGDKEQRRLELERQAVELGMLPSHVLSPEHQQELDHLKAEQDKRILNPEEKARLVALEMARRLTPEQAEKTVRRAYALSNAADRGQANMKEREDLEDLLSQIGTSDAAAAYRALEQLPEISQRTRKAGEPAAVDVPAPTKENTPEPSTPTEESHVEQPIAREPESAAPAEPQPGPGGVSESERGGDTGGSASGNVGGERPRSTGPRIITARSEHTQTADPGLVPQSVRRHLNEAQQQGTALAIDAMTKHGGFLLADGTGLGKTRQQLAVAQHFLDQGRKVVIVSPAEVIKPDWKKGSMSGSFANDSSVMGVPVKLTKGDGKIEPGSAHITTYNELGKLKDQIDKNTVVIFDESHFMKNRESARFKHGAEIMDKAASILYATATPGDKPLHIAHLARAGVFGNIGKTETYQKLGMRLVDQRVYGGGTVKVWQIDPKVGYKEAARRLSGLFDQMTKDGLMVKRELAMDAVNFRADRVNLSDEEHAAVRQAYDQKLKETRSAAFPNGNKAVALMTARMRQEPFKIPATVGMVQEELAAGRSPIVFLGRVNDITDEEEGKGEGESEVSFGTAGQLKGALLAAGIPAEQIGELHGAATKTPDAKKKAMNNFQEGKTRVMIATVQSGGTGVNLDDTTGERPRTVIMMTPPFTANDMAQAIGRVHRLNTKSESKVRGVLVDTHIDDWNAGILENKFRTLGAVVSGESTRGQAAYTPPEGLEEEEPKEPYIWGESLHPQSKFHANTPYAHNEVIGQFGGKRVNQGGEWTTQFPSREHYERYQQHVAPKPAPVPAPQPARSETVTPAASVSPSAVPPEQPAAAPMSAARKEAIHQALRQLHAANQDRASQRNGEGFNKMDSDFGGQLAEQSSLTDRQATAAARMLGKYRRQLGDELHGQITKPDKAEVASPPATATPPEPAKGAIGESPHAAVDLGEIPTNRVKTSRGERTVYSFRPTDSFWQARKEGKIPSNVTVRKDPRSGLWEVSIWGDSDKDIHDTVASLLRKKVQMHGFAPPGE